jgi:LysM repeat protein
METTLNAAATSIEIAALDAAVDTVKAETVLILQDSAELQANQGDWATATGFNTTTPDNAGIAAIQNKTDDMTYTKDNELDVNVKSENSATVYGIGISSDKWRGTE